MPRGQTWRQRYRKEMSRRLGLHTGFSTTHLAGGIDLHVLVDDKFKTTAATMVLQTGLGRDSVTKNALIPRVLRRGTASIPDTVWLERRLEDLYGTSLDVGVSKKGLRHLLAFQVEVAHERYIGTRQGLFRDGMDLLREMAFRARLFGGGLRERRAGERTSPTDRKPHR